MTDFAKALLLSSCAAAFEGPKTSQPRFFEFIDDAGRDRIVWTHDGEVDFVFLRECNQRGEIVLRDVHRLGELIDSGIARARRRAPIPTGSNEAASRAHARAHPFR